VLSGESSPSVAALRIITNVLSSVDSPGTFAFSLVLDNVLFDSWLTAESPMNGVLAKLADITAASITNKGQGKKCLLIWEKEESNYIMLKLSSLRSTI
jgi:hypothetical protein